MNLLALAFVILFSLLMLGFWLLAARQQVAQLRQIEAFERLQNAIDLAVEDGTRLHISLGHRAVTGQQSAAALVGLSMVASISQVASESDQPPVVTAGDGALGLLAQDTLRAAQQRLGRSASYDPTLGQVSGLTPYSYVAGALTFASDEKVSTNLLAGGFVEEVGLLSEAGERSGTLTLAGTDSLEGQAVLYASADEPLIGEELFAGGAYLGAGPMHVASLHAQDVLRWLLVLTILILALIGIVS